jgi:hypothetical protein
MAKQTSTYNNVKGLNRALMKLPRLAAAELRDASVEIARTVADDARGRAVRVGGVATYVAPTIKATRDRVPVVKMGSTARLPATNRSRSGSRQTVGDVIWGAEFGGRGRPTTQQFQPHRGTQGYFLWPAVRDNSDDIQRLYSEALDTALGKI